MSAQEEQIPTSVIPGNTQSILWGARLLTHMRKPENLLVYLMVTAWMKFMGVSEYIPTITVG